MFKAFRVILMKLTKEHLKLGAKLTLGVGVVVYVLRTNMVDLEKLHDVVFQPFNLFIGLLAMGMGVVVTATRWYFLVRAQGLSLSYKETIQLGMIGVFFNTFMPGTVGGDVIKAWYVAGHEPEKKTKAIFTIALDRVLGLTTILFYTGVTLMFFTEWLEAKPQLQAIAFAVWGFMGCALVFALFFFTEFGWKLKIVNSTITYFSRISFLENIIAALLLYRKHFKVIFFGMIFSAFNILSITLLFAYLGNALGIELALSKYFFVVPLGLVATGVPLLPGGIGVGQVAFFTLFSWAGLSNPELGGTLCTLWQIYFILFNCTGAFFYFKFKRRNGASLNPVTATN